MGGVFAAAAQAPLTAIASVAEMTGNFTLTLPIMLACGIAAQLARRITYGSIYHDQAAATAERSRFDQSQWERVVGPVTLNRRPQVLFAEEDLEPARRQLVLYGRDGLPVLTRDGRRRGWLTRADVSRALATKLSSSEDQIEDGAVAADCAVENPCRHGRRRQGLTL
jgi:CIC family chloride channel protein